MLVFVNANSLLALFFGWDGLGVSSFLLVVWYQRWSSHDGGMVTFLSNRLGDLLLVWGVCVLLFRGVVARNVLVGVVLSVVLIVACMTKRAQLPFSAWLPLAIRAPTPISSLVHSSTLVTGGVFLALKFGVVTREFFWVGVLTLFVAGAIRLLEMDAKKIVALSTLSQLGLMISGIGLGVFTFVLLHIVSHAFVKRALFMIVGVMMVRVFGGQDKRMLHTYSNGICLLFIFICGVSLCGLALTSGIVSKELLILERFSAMRRWGWGTGYLVGVRFTFVYCFRLIWVGFQ